MTRHPKQALLRAGSQTDPTIGWLLSTPAVSWVGCGLTTFFQVSGSSLQATWLTRPAAPEQQPDSPERPHLLPPWSRPCPRLSQGPSIPHEQPRAIGQVDIWRSHLKHPER